MPKLFACFGGWGIKKTLKQLTLKKIPDLIGESFTQANPPPSRLLYLRMGIEGITLKKMLPGSQAPPLPICSARCNKGKFVGNRS